MTDNKIRFLANSFKVKIHKAQSKNCFDGTMLDGFPEQCCGVASTLLAEYLRHNGVETLWVSAEEPGTYETHAWLVVKDDRIELPRSCFSDVSEDIIGLLGKYSGGRSEKIRNATCYILQASNLARPLCMLITWTIFINGLTL